MHCTRACIALLLISAFLAVGPSGAGAPSASAEVTQGCREREWGYRCFYGPFVVTPDTDQAFDFVPTPPEPGYITSMYATLVEPDGDRVPRHAAHLHHVLWGNPNRQDLTCTTPPFDRFDRFFATGKERTRIELPDGYGYYWDALPPPGYPDVPPTWVMAHHIMGMHEGLEQEVFVRFDIGFTPESEASLTDIVPLWLDVDNCGDSEYDVARGSGTDGIHEQTWDYTMPIGGELIALGGHLHDGGIKLRLDNLTKDRKMFVSRAVYRDEPGWDLRRMTSWAGVPGRHVDAGDELLLRSFYDDSRNRRGAMGIMIGALVPSMD
ncbi:MAG: hypothetical protein ACLGHL_00060 [Actinomycetota bacterium]